MNLWFGESGRWTNSSSYCNSILQCLYYSLPFREQVLSYPSRSPLESILNTPDGQPRITAATPSRNNEQTKPKPVVGPTSARGAGVTGAIQKPEDKDSPEYKKKQVLAKGPLIAMNYDNAASYGMTESMFTALKDLFEAIMANQSRIGVISPQKFLEILRRENEMFRTPAHQDAHEFLNLLLNQVVDTVEAEAKKLEASAQAMNGHAIHGQNDKIEKGIKAAAAVSATSGPTVLRNARWLHELFEGTLTSETKCLTCENTSQRDEPFLDLSVDLDQHSSVTSCLRKFSEEEMLCERDKFFCDNCGGLQEAEKRMKIKRLPKILALHLKRFKYTDDFRSLQKLFHRVVYPYHLRLFNTTVDAEDPDRLYELYAVVVHIGAGPNHGHYVSIIKTPDRGWLLFDDEMVEPVDKSFVRNFFGDRPGMASAYVLFYQETTLEAVKREQEAEASAAATSVPVEEREGHGLGLTLKTNGLSNTSTQAHPISASPADEDAPNPWQPLDHALSAPPATGTPLSAIQKSAYPTPIVPSETEMPVPFSALASSPKKPEVASKKERAREEKERKAAEKEREKREKATRKSTDNKRKEHAKKESTDLKAAFDASIKEAEKVASTPPKETIVPYINGNSPVKPTAASTNTNTTSTPNGLPQPPLQIQSQTQYQQLPLPPTPTQSTATSALSRFRQTSKSLKHRPKFWPGSGSSSTAKDDVAVEDESTALEETEGKDKEKKTHRFSLRKKASAMLS